MRTQSTYNDKLTCTMYSTIEHHTLRYLHIWLHTSLISQQVDNGITKTEIQSWFPHIITINFTKLVWLESVTKLRLITY